MQNQSLAESFNLSKRIQLVELENNTIGIIKKRKSRIIMKDGAKILEIARKIWTIDPSLKIALIISGPICSKTRKFLGENNITIKSDTE